MRFAHRRIRVAARRGCDRLRERRYHLLRDGLSLRGTQSITLAGTAASDPKQGRRNDQE